MLNFADAAWDEVVGARAEAAEEHGGLCLALQRAADAGRREAGRRAAEGGGSRREGEDELHLIQTRPTGSVTTRCTERLVTAI